MKGEHAFINNENFRLDPSHQGLFILPDPFYQLFCRIMTQTNTGKRMDCDTTDITRGDT